MLRAPPRALPLRLWLQSPWGRERSWGAWLAACSFAHCAAVLDTEMYVFAGHDGRSPLNDLFVLDTGACTAAAAAAAAAYLSMLPPPPPLPPHARAVKYHWKQLQISSHSIMPPASHNYQMVGMRNMLVVVGGKIGFEKVYTLQVKGARSRCCCCCCCCYCCCCCCCCYYCRCYCRCCYCRRCAHSAHVQSQMRPRPCLPLQIGSNASSRGCSGRCTDCWRTSRTSRAMCAS
ncbi:MAG: Kelch repeat-containing protein [Allorhizobium sp.]